jgi:predicted transposase/invertase (TIGR01784 family)
MAFRALQYIVGLMNNDLSQNGHEKLPIILPVVLYHGKTSPYPYSTEIWDCFENPELAKQWALKPFQLIDLTVMSDEEIQQHHLFSAMETVFKHAREREVLDWVEKLLIQGGKLAIIYSKIDSEYAEDFIKCLLGMLGNSLPKEVGQQLLARCAGALPTIGDKIMTFAEQFKQEGLQQGLQQGLERGERNKSFEIAKNLLMSGVDQQIIKLSTGLTDDEISKLCLH